MKQVNLVQGMVRITSYALPISGTNLINMLSNFIAMLMVAQIGKVELAAGALAIPTYLMVTTIAATSLYAIGILISNYRGQEKTACDIGKIVKNGIWFACFITIPAGLILWHADKLLLIFGQSQQLIQIARPYFHYSALALLPTLLAGVIGQFYTGIGKPKFAMLTSTIRLPFIILLSYISIFGQLGFPRLGLAGIMCALLIVQTVFCICMTFYLYCTENIRKYQLFSGQFLPNWLLCKNIFTIGMPIGLQFGGELAAIVAATYLMGSFGVTALAASQIVSQYSMLVIMVILGLSQALSVLISEASGRQDYILVKKHLTSSLMLLSLIFVFVISVFLFGPKMLIKFYTDVNNDANSNLIQLAISLFMVSGIMLFVGGIRDLFSGVLRGLHDSKTPMKAGIVCSWLISLPIGYLVAFVFHGGPIGLRIGFSSGSVVAALVLFRHVFKKLRIP